MDDNRREVMIQALGIAREYLEEAIDKINQELEDLKNAKSNS